VSLDTMHLSTFNFRLMKKFIVKIVLISFLALASLYIIQFTVFKSIFLKRFMSYFGTEVYVSMKNSSVKDKSIKKIVLGDSSGKQLFPEENTKDSILSLTCNQAITLVGHYILLQNYFSNNQNHMVKKVLLLYHPVSFENNMDMKYTYHYLLKPFYCGKTKKYFATNTIDIIKTIPYSCFCQFPLIKMTNYNPTYKFKEGFDYKNFYLSSVSIQYLKLINELCEKNNCKFKVISPILKMSFRNSFGFINLKRQINSAGLDQMFDTYFNNMTFIEDTLFVDDIHFKKESLKRVLAETKFLDQVYQ
jgi:hypothetical protein